MAKLKLGNGLSSLSKPKTLSEQENKEIEEKLNQFIEKGGDSANAKLLETKKKEVDPNKLTSFTIRMPRYKIDEIKLSASKVAKNTDEITSYTKKKTGISMEEWIVRAIEEKLAKNS